jgi:hypothetical protein
MSQTFWESEVAEQPAQEKPAMASAESGALTVSADDFSALEQRIFRAVELVKNERKARAEAEHRAAIAEGKLEEQSPAVQSLQEEVRALRAERDQVRQRVERLITQLDALEL